MPAKLSKPEPKTSVLVHHPWKAETPEEREWCNKLAFLVLVKQKRSATLLTALGKQYPWLARNASLHDPDQVKQYENRIQMLLNVRFPSQFFPMNKSHASEKGFVKETLQLFFASDWCKFLDERWNSPIGKSEYTPRILRAFIFNAPSPDYHAVAARIALEIKLTKAVMAYRQDMPPDTAETRRLFWLIIHMHAALDADFDSRRIAKWNSWSLLANDEPELTGIMNRALVLTVPRCAEFTTFLCQAENRLSELVRDIIHFLSNHPHGPCFDTDHIQFREWLKKARNDTMLVRLRIGVPLLQQPALASSGELLELRCPPPTNGLQFKEMNHAREMLEWTRFIVGSTALDSICDAQGNLLERTAAAAATSTPASSVVFADDAPSLAPDTNVREDPFYGGIDQIMDEVTEHLLPQKGNDVEGSHGESILSLFADGVDGPSALSADLDRLAPIMHLVKFEEVLATRLQCVVADMAELHGRKMPECASVAEDVMECLEVLQELVVDTWAMCVAEQQTVADEIRAMVESFKGFQNDLFNQKKLAVRAMRKILRKEKAFALKVMLSVATSDQTHRAIVQRAEMKRSLVEIMHEIDRLGADIMAVRIEESDLFERYTTQQTRRSFAKMAQRFLPPAMHEERIDCSLCLEDLAWNTDREIGYVVCCPEFGFVCGNCLRQPHANHPIVAEYGIVRMVAGVRRELGI